MKTKVLDILRTEARTSVGELARRLGATEAEVERTIADLEANRTILGYAAVVDPEKLDAEPCTAIINVKLSPQRNRGYDAIAAHIHRFPEVKLCYLLSGEYDLLVFVEGPSLKSVALFVTEKLATIENVLSTNTHFILKKYKEFGVRVGPEERADRLAVSP